MALGVPLATIRVCHSRYDAARIAGKSTGQLIGVSAIRKALAAYIRLPNTAKNQLEESMELIIKGLWRNIVPGHLRLSSGGLMVPMTGRDH